MLPGGIQSIVADRNALLRGESHTLIPLLVNHGASKCHNPRDRVFSMLTISSDCVKHQREIVDYTLNLPTLYLGLRNFNDNKMVGFSLVLQQVLKINFHKFVQPGDFEDWFCRHYGTFGKSVLDGLKIARSDDRLFRAAKQSLVQQTSGGSFFSKAALKYGSRHCNEVPRLRQTLLVG
jgi:hypothetical protein